jgi:hypothetical protein
MRTPAYTSASIFQCDLGKVRPGRPPTAFGRRFDAAALQHIGYRLAPDLVLQVGQRCLNPRVSPPRIVPDHAHNQLGDLVHDPWPPSPAQMREIPFLGDQLSVPTQQSVWRNDRVQLGQRFAPHCLRFPREQRSLGVGEPDPLSAHPVFEQSALGSCKNSMTISWCR